MDPDSDDYFPSWELADTQPDPEPDLETPSEPEAEEPAEQAAPLAKVPDYSMARGEELVKRNILVPVEVNTALSERQRQLLDSAMVDSVLFGADDAAMTCHGEGGVHEEFAGQKIEPCPYANKCWFRRVGLPYPLGDPCPIEKALMATWVRQAQEDLGIQPGDQGANVDSSFAQHLAGLSLMRRRAMHGMAENPELERIFTNSTRAGDVTVVTGNMNTDYLMKAIELSRKVAEHALLTRKARAQTEGDTTNRSLRQVQELTERVHRQVKRVTKRAQLDDAGVVRQLEEIHEMEDES